MKIALTTAKKNTIQSVLYVFSVGSLVKVTTYGTDWIVFFFAVVSAIFLFLFLVIHEIWQYRSRCSRSNTHLCGFWKKHFSRSENIIQVLSLIFTFGYFISILYQILAVDMAADKVMLGKMEKTVEKNIIRMNQSFDKIEQS